MTDQWTDRLSEYLDGELPAAERAALDAHLAGCAGCRATLDELRAVVARAQALEDRPPATDLWPGIGGALTTVRPDRPDRRRFSLTAIQLLAACIAVVLLTSGVMWLALREDPGTGVTQGPQGGVVTPASWTARTDFAIAELEDELSRNESRLDSATVRVVREKLAIIDRAIAEAQRALQNDPGSTYLNLHLAETMRRKIKLLRRANALATAES